MAIICYIKKKSGRYAKRKSRETKNGGKFQYGGKTYEPPLEENREVMTLKHWLLGWRQFAYYREGVPTPIPLDKDTAWRDIDNPADDQAFLAGIVKQALYERAIIDGKLNAAVAGQGLTILLLLIHWFW